jgi:hypothetical protein
METRRWTSNLAYAVGLVATDGCLSKDGRHIDFTSKDLDQINNFQKSLGIHVKVGSKKGGYSDREYYRVQFGDVKLYRWLETIGLYPNKSLTIGELKISDKYFFDFLRGHFDGDGSFYSYWDPRWKSSFMYYLQFTSSSKAHLQWLSDQIIRLVGAYGSTKKSTRSFNLAYAKKSSNAIIEKMYADKNCICLSRKRDKIFTVLSVK